MQYCTADLRLCFRIGKNSNFSWRGSSGPSVLQQVYGVIDNALEERMMFLLAFLVQSWPAERVELWDKAMLGKSI